MLRPVTADQGQQ